MDILEGLPETTAPVPLMGRRGLPPAPDPMLLPAPAAAVVMAAEALGIIGCLGDPPGEGEPPPRRPIDAAAPLPLPPPAAVDPDDPSGTRGGAIAEDGGISAPEPLGRRERFPLGARDLEGLPCPLPNPPATREGLEPRAGLPGIEEA